MKRPIYVYQKHFYIQPYLNYFVYQALAFTNLFIILYTQLSWQQVDNRRLLANIYSVSCSRIYSMENVYTGI